MLGRQISSLNAFESISLNLTRGYFRNYDAFDAPEMLQAITTHDISEYIRQYLLPDNLALCVIRPKKRG